MSSLHASFASPTVPTAVVPALYAFSRTSASVSLTQSTSAAARMSGMRPAEGSAGAGAALRTVRAPEERARRREANMAGGDISRAQTHIPQEEKEEEEAYTKEKEDIFDPVFFAYLEAFNNA